MAKIRTMGEQCFADAQQGLALVKTNRDQAEQALKFMKAYQLLSAYYEKKVAAATVGQIYFYSRLEEDKRQAETLADAALTSYEQVAAFLHEQLDPVIESLYGM